MKFKNVIFSICLVLIFFSENSVSDSKQTEINSPESVVKKFYKEYLVADGSEDIEVAGGDLQKAINKYTTKHLRKVESENDTGADYFLDAQDTCPEWVDHIAVERIKVNNGTALVKLRLGYKPSLSEYTVKLKKQNDRWLMDSVRLDSRGSSFCNDN
ncbi:DUF3828 domain-containing protein [Serratia sp. DD3]|uniref:DUF3828 domain-containing protein n=1 Tax=Serratia sp. DD3 TaxID=1410619 RepID=UPI0003C4F6E8|nr:DUF3828 domain-containing protein [Serratia sp. DD3]KEY57891.1 hypothetical protein SRDD_32030 [Serratia sp. DD3]